MVDDEDRAARGGAVRPGAAGQWRAKYNGNGTPLQFNGADVARQLGAGARQVAGGHGGGHQDGQQLDGDEQEGTGQNPAGPFLRDYQPVGGFRHTSARTASVLFYRNGGYSIATVSGVEHVNKPTLARPRTVCEIALGTYVTTLDLELPAAGGAAFFKAEVDIHWTVVDPHLAATQVVTDVGQRLTGPTLERLREVSAEHQVTHAEAADRAVTRQCASGRWDDLGADLGLRVRLYVRLRVDDRTIEYADGIRDAHASAEVTRVHQDNFRAMLQGGDLEQLTYMLAAEPEEAKHFLEKIRQEGRQDEKERIDRLFEMVTSGQIQNTDLELQALHLLNRGRHRVQGPIGSSPVHRDAPQLLPPPPEPPTAGPYAAGLMDPAGPLDPAGPAGRGPAARPGQGGGEPFTPDWVWDDTPQPPPRRGPAAPSYRDPAAPSYRDPAPAAPSYRDPAPAADPPYDAARPHHPHPGPAPAHGPADAPYDPADAPHAPGNAPYTQGNAPYAQDTAPYDPAGAAQPGAAGPAGGGAGRGGGDVEPPRRRSRRQDDGWPWAEEE
ncbi:hypothetical protein AAHZ94_10180 [Streptomyces sp. HSW2009]|uniref:hypothetical protein n=1 Tax=Streptomyces sp. HSW2009 TaxID=3142890 RepID=UPI0032EEAD84